METLLGAIAHGKEEKNRIEKAKEHLDAYQDQLLQESHIFLAKSLTELEQYGDELAVCDEGCEITKNNLIKVQKRLTTKRMEEEKREVLD